MSHSLPYEKYLVIRNQTSGLVLDASKHEVNLQHFTGFSSQLWKLEIAGAGTFYFLNKKNGNVLTIQGGETILNSLITDPKYGGPTQQWYINDDGTITSGGKHLALDVYDYQYTAGNKIIAFTKHGEENQKFYLQSQ